jgi:uncharacterized membrane protein
VDTLVDILEYIALGIGALALLVILWGVIKGIVEVVRVEISGRKAEEDRQYVLLGQARYHIGYHLLLGLEFLIAADIVRTIVRPTLEELAILGVIVAIRIVIGYFLGREVSQFRSRQ